MNAVKVVAFDCDGVLFNTDRANRAYYNAMLTHLGKPMLTAEQFAFVHMHTVTESLHRLFPDDAEFEAAQRFRKQMDYHPFIRKMEMEPGLIPLLTRIKPRYQTAIATNRTDTMDAVMLAHGLSEYFDLVVSARDVLHPKPHPEPLQKILTHFQADPDQVVYVGDTAVDAQAAKGAGVVFIAYNNPALPADDHIRRLEDLETILLGRSPIPAGAGD
jgi:HAD superfamily hydrolase (TIGR01509 family)